MAGFLDNYGAGDERRARNIKIAVVSVIGLVVLSGFLYFFFRNHRQEQQARRFYQLLAARDYQAAYSMWVSSDSERQGYPMATFMQDWGPPAVDVRSYDILDAESCGNNVIVDADLGPLGNRKVWVNRKSLELGFPPYEQCPQQNRIYDLYRNVKYKLHGRTYK
jgi:hypothetical protein